MKFDNLITEPCETQEDCSGISRRTPVELIVLADAVIEVGETWQFQAILKFSDDTTEDVSDNAVWSISDIASIVQTGLATGNEAGVATVTASAQGLSGYAALTILTSCIGSGVDYVYVLDRSSALNTPVGIITLRDCIYESVKGQLSNLKDLDQASLVSFAGLLTPGSPASTSGEATLDHILSSDSESLLEANTHYGVRGPCAYPDENTGPGTRCSRGLGSGLQLALAELSTPRHTTHKAVVVLVFYGNNPVNSPDPVALAQLLKDRGFVVAVFGIRVAPDYVSTARAIASCGFYFPVDDASQLSVYMASIPRALCTGYYYYCGVTPTPSTPSTPPPAAAANLAGLRWELPCSMETTWAGCPCTDPPDQTVTMGGTAGVLYDVVLRLRGLIELKNIIGGTRISSTNAYGPYPFSNWLVHVAINQDGTPSEDQQGGFNRYSLQTSDPAHVYYLNEGVLADGTSAAVPEVPVDLQVTIQIKGGASVTLKARSQDGLEFKNNLNIVIPGVPPFPNAFNGQFLNLDVISVTPA